MKVAYHLRPLPFAEPANALLVPGRQAEDALQLCAALGLDPMPAVHLVADGFLIKLSAPHDGLLAGVIRLRGLSADLLLPVDAELVPPLLADEAAALVRQRGLVFLPGGRVLEFDPNETLPMHALVRVGAVQRTAWSALPEPTELAEELREIALDVPAALPPEVLEAGGDGVGTETPEIPDAPLPSKVAGKALFSLGKGFARLGSALHLRGLGSIGAALLGGAMALMPRLSEQLIGKQEAMLRNLLRQFREGKIEEALRRALPFMGDDLRGAVAAGDARLPRHDLFYSLVNLLGDRGARGGGTFWSVQGNIWHELAQEYRNQADLAAARGDFRRAAFIYGKLLRDYRAAAIVLSRGGRYRDAATLYERAVKDLPAAAREWEASGEVDRALQIYLTIGDHISAGDLLRRAGEEERAVEQYQLAAARLVESSPRYYEAGQLLESRAARIDLAMPYYEAGWQARPHGNPVPCVLRLARHHTMSGECRPLLELTSEAEEFLDAWDPESAASFYNALARHADTPSVALVAAELRDRARLGLARKLVQGSERGGGNYLATLFPAESPGPAPLVRDAEHAMRHAGRERACPRGARGTQRRVRQSTVRAVCQLPVCKDVFLGLESGEVVVYRPDTGDVTNVTEAQGPIRSLVACGSDDHLAVLSRVGSHRVCLAILSRSSGYRMQTCQHLAIEGATWLCTLFENEPSNVVGVYAGGMYCVYRVPDLVPQGPGHHLANDDPAALLLGPVPNSPRGAWVLAFYPSRVEWYINQNTPAWSVALPWTPSGGDRALTHPWIQAIWNGDAPLEIMGLDAHGGLRQSLVHLGAAATPKTISAWPGDDEPFQAFARVRTGLWAGVTRKEVHWLRGNTAKPAAPPTPIRVASPVAAFALPETNELLVVEADTTLLRVPVRG
jgi:tetratricopeptide (TPR) repeat protein